MNGQFGQMHSTKEEKREGGTNVEKEKIERESRYERGCEEKTNTNRKPNTREKKEQFTNTEMRKNEIKITI